MELEVKLKLTDVFGGDGFTRIEKMKQTKLSRLKKKTVTRHDIGVPVVSDTSEEQTELKNVEVHTFKRDADGAPLLRLGGVHGKFWGVMKEVAEMLKDTQGLFKSYAEIERFMRTVRVYPIYVRLENLEGGSVESLPQILAGGKKSMIIQHFDIIQGCDVKIKLAFPDPNKDKIRKILEHVENVACLNKRRSTIKIVD